MHFLAWSGVSWKVGICCYHSLFKFCWGFVRRVVSMLLWTITKHYRCYTALSITTAFTESVIYLVYIVGQFLSATASHGKWVTRSDPVTARAIDTVISLMKKQICICFVGDEALFNFSRYVSSQNNRYWSTENPVSIHEVPLYDEIGCVVCYECN